MTDSRQRSPLWLVAVLGAALAAGTTCRAESPTVTQSVAVFQQGRGPIVRTLDAEERAVYSGVQVTIEYTRGRETTRTVQEVWWDGPNGRSVSHFKEPSWMMGSRLVRQGGDLWQYEPQGGRWLHSTAGSGLLMDLNYRARKLFDNYLVELVKEDRVAGYRCMVYDLLPRLSGNPSRRLYVEADSYMPLRTENVNGEGELVSATTFDRIEFHRSLPGQLFAAPGNDERVEEDPVQREGPLSLADARRRLSFLVSDPGYVPQGYEFAGAFLIHKQGQEVALLQWFDGLSLLSLFKQPSGISDPPTGWEEFHANSVSWVADGYYYTLIGDIIPSELSSMRDTIR